MRGTRMSTACDATGCNAKAPGRVWLGSGVLVARTHPIMQTASLEVPASKVSSFSVGRRLVVARPAHSCDRVLQGGVSLKRARRTRTWCCHHDGAERRRVKHIACSNMQSQTLYIAEHHGSPSNHTYKTAGAHAKPFRLTPRPEGQDYRDILPPSASRAPCRTSRPVAIGGAQPGRGR